LNPLAANWAVMELRTLEYIVELAIGSRTGWFCLCVTLLPLAVALLEEWFVWQVTACGNPAGVSSPRRLFCLRILFGRTRARCFGAVAETWLPTAIRSPIYRLFSWVCGCNLDEVDGALDSFPSLSDFFCRSLREGLRPIDDLPTGLVSPVDGRVLTIGTVDKPNARVEQVKGTTYSVRGFLGFDPTEAKAPGSTILYAVVYLSPGDYHRVHAPCDCLIDKARHFSGELLPVGGLPQFMHDVFSVNERLVLSGTWRYGPMHLAAVGAANVGNIYLCFDPALRTNTARSPTVHIGGDVSSKTYPGGVGLNAGDTLGGFRLGSTVVIVFEAPSGFEWRVERGSKVRLGEPLGQVLA